MTDLEEWAAIEAAWSDRHTRDHDEHVRTRDRFESLLRVQLVLRFSERARVVCEQAERDLVAAIDRAQTARAYLIRTTETLEQACKLHTMGRP